MTDEWAELQEYDEDRNFLNEARKILAGTTMMLCERRHLEALVEHYECQAIKTGNRLEMLKKDLFNETL